MPAWRDTTTGVLCMGQIRWSGMTLWNNSIEHDPNRNGEGENIAFFQGHDSADCADALIGW